MLATSSSPECSQAAASPDRSSPPRDLPPSPGSGRGTSTSWCHPCWRPSKQQRTSSPCCCHLHPRKIAPGTLHSWLCLEENLLWGPCRDPHPCGTTLRFHSDHQLLASNLWRYICGHQRPVVICRVPALNTGILALVPGSSAPDPRGVLSVPKTLAPFARTQPALQVTGASKPTPKLEASLPKALPVLWAVSPGI